MRHASLFSGIGGPEVAAAMLGWENVFHCEINEFGRKVLEYWFPDSESYEDITKTDFRNIEERLTSSQEDSLVSLFPMPVKGGGRQMTAISGRKCSELLTKSGRLGSLVKMLLESEQWSSNAGLLTWEVKPLCSKRVMEFTDTQQSSPSPLNESARTLSQRDIQSSRCLFRLVLSAHHTEGIESSSLLITPTAVMTCENPDNMRAERKGYQNGTKFGSLESQVMYDPKVKSLLKTPCAMDCSADSRKSKGISGTSGTLAQEIMSGYVMKRGWILPTPTAMEGEKYTNTYNPDSQMGKSLSAMAGLGMLPTPSARDWKGVTNPGVVKEGSGCIYGETLPDAVKRLTSDPKEDGKAFRLSPLFTEEMMGFPLMWTALPFLSQNGEQNQ